MNPQSISLLVVGDKPTQTDLKNALEPIESPHITHVPHPQEAFEAAGTAIFDLVLLDLASLQGEVANFVSRFKSFPNQQNAVIIVVGMADDPVAIAGLLDGVDDYLRLPLLIPLLRARLMMALQVSTLRHELDAARREKGKFVSFVAHELKTPMTAIKGYTDLLISGVVGPVTEAQSGFLQTVRNNITRLATLITDLADFSKVDSNQLYLEPEIVFVPDVVRDVTQSLKSQTQAKQQTVTITIPADLPPVWTDRGRTIQILSILLDNAIRYTGTGGQITIGAEAAANHGDSHGAPAVVHLWVQDTGIGISATEQPRVFTPFFRSQDDVVREQLGNGLGLALARGVTKVQGGQLWFDTELGHGSTFHVTLPVNQ